MPKIDFDNIEVAFAHKSDQELKKAYWIFSLFNILWLNKILNILGGIAFSMKLPLGFIVQNNIFKHFCGGTTLMKCEKTVDLIKAHNVESNLDYSKEEKISLLRFMWQTAYSDGVLDVDEERLVRRVADLIRIKDVEVLKLKHDAKS